MNIKGNSKVKKCKHVIHKFFARLFLPPSNPKLIPTALLLINVSLLHRKTDLMHMHFDTLNFDKTCNKYLYLFILFLFSILSCGR